MGSKAKKKITQLDRIIFLEKKVTRLTGAIRRIDNHFTQTVDELGELRQEQRHHITVRLEHIIKRVLELTKTIENLDQRVSKQEFQLDEIYLPGANVNEIKSMIEEMVKDVKERLHLTGS